MAVTGLHCCARVFSSYKAWTSHCYGFSCRGAQPLGMWASVVTAHGLSCPQHVGTSQIRVQTCDPCIGRWILNHWTIKEVPLQVSLMKTITIAHLINMWNEYTAMACPSIPRKGYLMLLWVPLSLPSCNQVLQIGKQTEPKPNLVCEPMVF